MKIYTSYYGNVKNLPPNIVPISIAGKCPIKGIKECRILAPKYDWFKVWKAHQNEYKIDWYINKYFTTVLNKLNAKTVVDLLYELGEGKDVALCCYEKPGDFCHRHLVAKWLIANGYYTKEYKEPTIFDESE